MPSMSQRVRHIIGDSFGAAIVEQTIEKALRDAKERAASPESTFYDPLSLFVGRAWLNKTSTALSFHELRAMSSNPIIGSIVQTRLSQIASFMVPQESTYDFGYKIVSQDPEAEENLEETRNLSQFIYRAGIPGYGEPLLDTLSRKYMRDSLTMDQACAEIVYRRNDEPAYLVGLDGATIRRTKASLEHAIPPQEDEVHYVQILQERIVTEYLDKQMMFGVRNPQTDIRLSGYGMSELEMLVRTVTTILNTEKFNAGQLTAGGTQKGVLVIKGQTDNIQVDSFKRDFREAIRNASSYWRPPVLQIGKDADVDWLTLDRSNKDMEYAQLFDFLVKQACGVYQIDPTEINWQIGASGTRTTFESSQMPKVKSSKEKGLKPLLTFFANQLNLCVIDRIDPRYRIEFVGMNQDRKTDAEIREREVRNFKTINEQRAELGLAPVENGDIILNENWMRQAEGLGNFEEAGVAEEVDVEDSFD